MAVAILRLYLLHLFASIAVWLATYYPGLDLLLSLLYLYLLYREGRVRPLATTTQWLVGFIWQAPALVFAMLSTGLFHLSSIAGYGIFLLSFWATPLLPLFSLATHQYQGYPLYFPLLLLTPLLLILFWVYASCGFKTTHNHSAYRM